MSTEHGPVAEDELHAWLDEQLPPERGAAVERWLQQHPADAARFARYREQRALLRALLQPKFEEAVPKRLARALRQPVIPVPLRRLAASVALLMLGGTVGWSLPHPSSASSGRLTAEAVQAHVVFVKDVRHPVEVAADQENHLVTWLSNRLGRKLLVPNLSSFGFHLIGGRLLPGSGAPSAQFMFEDQSGARLTLYIHSQSPGGTGFNVVERDGVSGFRWFEDGLMYVVLANTGRDKLLGIAETIDHQLPRPEPPRSTGN